MCQTVARTEVQPGTGSATYCSAVSARQASSIFALAHRLKANREAKSSFIGPTLLLGPAYCRGRDGGPASTRAFLSCPAPRFWGGWPASPYRSRGRQMKRAGIAALGLIVAGAAVGLWFTSQTGARPTQARQPEEGARTSTLPVAQVVLYSSGVGYFQREGSVEGDARVDLSFPVSDINDLIKSMVLRDLDGGHVSAVSYDSNAPVERTLRSFAVDLT